MRKLKINIKKLESLYRADLSIDKIANKLNVSHKSIEMIVKSLGWKRKPVTRKIKLSLQKIKDLKKMGLNREDISKKLNINRTSLIKFEKENGLYVEDPIRIEAYKKSRKTLKENISLGLKPEPRHNWTRLDKYVDDIQDLFLKGVSQAEIAKRYNVCRSTIYNFVLLHNIQIPKVGLLDSKKDIIIEMFNKGKSTRAIANSIGHSYQTVKKEMEKMNLIRNPKDIRYDSRVRRQEDLIKKLYFSGMMRKDIAKKVHAHPSAVRRVIRQFEIIKNPEWRKCKLDKTPENEVLKMRATGMSFKKIGLHFGVTAGSVFLFVKELEKILNEKNFT